MSENPVFGLGFGHDLARDFLMEYNPEIEDFTARSPHSIVVSTIGRMGLAGLVAFLVFAGVLVVRTWRTFRSPDITRLQLGLWAAVWVILVSACFGVVLEGPMGAVVFWILLGMANAATTEPTDPDTATVNAGTEQGLNDPTKSAEVAASS
jgi:O-antigen ligase